MTRPVPDHPIPLDEKALADLKRDVLFGLYAGSSKNARYDARVALERLCALALPTPAPSGQAGAHFQPMRPGAPVLEALTLWRSFWETEHADALLLTGRQADELCTLLAIPFDGKPSAVPPNGETETVNRMIFEISEYARSDASKEAGAPSTLQFALRLGLRVGRVQRLVLAPTVWKKKWMTEAVLAAQGRVADIILRKAGNVGAEDWALIDALCESVHLVTLSRDEPDDEAEDEWYRNPNHADSDWTPDSGTPK